MDRDRFESEVIDLAAEGVPLTVANVASRTRLPPRKAEAMLDEMLRAGHLDSEIDEDEGVLRYKVLGLSKKAAKKKVAVRDEDDEGVRAGIARAAGQVLVKQAASKAKKAVLETKPGEKSVLVGLLLGLFLGPFGLLYAAPWGVAIGSILAYAVGWKVVAWVSGVPLIGTLVHVLAGLVHLVVTIASALYVLRYNREGKRAALLPPEKPGRD